MTASRPKKLQSLMRYSSLGFEVVASIAVFSGVGYGLDRLARNERPWFLLIFALLGCAAAIWLAIRAVFKKP